MSNPFELIDQRLKSIESLLCQLLEASPEQNPPEDHITAREAAKLLNRSLSRLYSTIKSYPHKKIGGKLIFSRKELEDFVNSNQVANIQSKFSETEKIMSENMQVKRRMRSHVIYKTPGKS